MKLHPEGWSSEERTLGGLESIDSSPAWHRLDWERQLDQPEESHLTGGMTGKKQSKTLWSTVPGSQRVRASETPSTALILAQLTSRTGISSPVEGGMERASAPPLH